MELPRTYGDLKAFALLKCISEKNRLLQKADNFNWMRSSLLASVEVEFGPCNGSIFKFISDESKVKQQETVSSERKRLYTMDMIKQLQSLRKYKAYMFTE
jgi:hypothetical protein